MKLASLTFDDGSERKISQIDYAVPILNEHNVKGTFFVCPAGIKDWKPWKELVDSGHEIGSHTMTHPNLLEMSQADPFRASFLNFEIADSKKAIEDIVGNECKTFAYPYGKFDERVKEIVRNNYDTARAGSSGFGGFEKILPPDRYALRQVHIGSCLRLEWPTRIQRQKRWDDYDHMMKKDDWWAIFILHGIAPGDGKDRPITRRVSTTGFLREAIQSLKSMGVKFVTINEVFSCPLD